MDIKLQRLTFGEDGVFGILTGVGIPTIASTLEHAFPVTEGSLTRYEPKVAAGVYTCLRHAPNRLPYETWELQNVPEFQGQPVTGILIHVGNFNRNSDGCILVGRNIMPNPDAPAENMVTSSQNTFNKLMDLTRNLDSFILTIE
jgi:hypothetical protein